MYQIGKICPLCASQEGLEGVVVIRERERRNIMNKDINGHSLFTYQVVVDPYGQLLVVEELLPNGKVKCRNGCMFVHWEPERLKRVNYKEDLL